MRGIVIAQTLRTSWKQILYWGLGLGLLGMYIVFIGSDRDLVQGYAKLFESLPPAMLQAFGASSIDMFQSVEGWVVTLFVSEAGIFISVFAVMAGLNITSNDENAGTMDVIMSLPISRSVYLLERWIGYALIGFAILLATAMMITVTVLAASPGVQAELIFWSILNLYPGLLLVMTVTSLLTSLLQRRAVAIGLVTVYIISSFMATVIAAAASGPVADLMEGLSFFSYAQGEAIVSGSYEPAGTVALLLVALAACGISVALFNRRDLGL